VKTRFFTRGWPRGPRRVGGLHASVEGELLLLADEEAGAESRWNRPRRRRNPE
jgi:hypothetical protein